MIMRIVNFFARRTLIFQGLKQNQYLIRIKKFLDSWDLVKQFTFSSFFVMLIGMVAIGSWLGEKIELGVIKEAATTTALYMDSFIAPNIQELGQSNSLTLEHIQTLDTLFDKNNLGQRTVSVKIWSKDNYIIYSNIPALVGRTFPNTEDQVNAWQGKVTGEISNLQELENIEERRLTSERLLEIYSPVHLNGTNQIIAVVEFYQNVNTLEAEILAAQKRGWLMVGATITVMYLLLVIFVRWVYILIKQKEKELKKQVAQLSQSLSQNKELTRRVRISAANMTALNENLLRRTSAELHDGPVQQIGSALLRLDQAINQNETCRLVNPHSKCNDSLPVVQTTLQSALQKMRNTASGLALPQLDNLPLPEVLFRVVHSHEQQSQTKVTLAMNDVPDQATLQIKITAYRFIQEGLKNAHRHANGIAQQVQVTCKAHQVQIKITDEGAGFDVTNPLNRDDYIGLAGMRERVESTGGVFNIESNLNEGTKVIAILFLQNSGEYTNG